MRRSGFTFVEMLAVVAIIALISATALFTMRGASEQAKAARTKTLIKKIDIAIMRQWDTYSTRRVNATPAGQSRTLRAFSRVAAIRELQRMELPERKADLMIGSQVPGLFPAHPTRPPGPALWNAYRRRVARIYNPSWQTGDPILWGNWSPQFQGSECLYLILTHMRDGDSTARDAFQPSDFGDTDEDGIPEVLDGWDRPIEFLRWAPGYISDPVHPQLAMATDQTRDATLSPDPFDPLKTDPRLSDSLSDNDPYMLKPLVYSGGADRIHDITSEIYDVAGVPTVDYGSPSPDLLSTGTTIPAAFLTNDPYRHFQDGSDWHLMGTPGGLDAGDNITNHNMEVR